MRAIQEFSFFKDAAAGGSSNTLYVDQYSESATIQVGGGFNSCSLRIQGKTDASGAWTDLAVIDKTAFSVDSAITEAGIYTLDVSGLKQVRAVLDSVSGGTITVYALCKGGE